jgi:hypothetical protein
MAGNGSVISECIVNCSYQEIDDHLLNGIFPTERLLFARSYPDDTPAPANDAGNKFRGIFMVVSDSGSRSRPWLACVDE